MLWNYLKITWRNIARSKTFSFVNILGLSLGMACSILIMLWVIDERSVDGFHKNNKDLYQVYQRITNEGKTDGTPLTQGLLAAELKKVIPEVKYASSFDNPRLYTLEGSDKANKQEGGYASPDFFKMFSYGIVAGAANEALTNPNSIAVSRKMAEEYFGSAQQAIGKTLRFDNKESLIVTAVFENVPHNSSIKFDFLRTWIDFVKANRWADTWGSASPLTFIQLREDANRENVESKLKDFFYRYQLKEKSSTVEFGLQPYRDRYLHSIFTNGYPDGGRVAYVRLFSVVAIFILLIACINFMNLATARATRRAKEVGVRKVIGANKASLIGQFIGEALFLSLLSLILGIALVIVSLPYFNVFTGKDLRLPLDQLSFWSGILTLLMVTGIIAGSYPALFMSSMNPVKVLKGTLKFNWSSLLFRKGLVVFQFSLSIILIVCMVVFYRQIDYVQKKNLGYDRENLVYIPIEGSLTEKYQLFKTEASRMPGILSISKTRESPTVITHHISDFRWPEKDPNEISGIADAVVGYDFAKTLKLQLVEGRDFSESFGSDTTAFLVNESAMHKMNYEHAVGKTVWWNNKQGTIIGVLKDFHFNSLHEKIEPLMIRLKEDFRFGSILVRTKGGQTKEAIKSLEAVHKAVNPSIPFTYQFSDDAYTALYKSEQVVSTLTNCFAALAIFISCLGLFGLATFSAEQRIKEIGVRKTLGASITDIVRLLSGNFLKPVILAMVIAFPIAWYAGNQWLQEYSYKINFSPWIFVMAGGLTLVIAIATVSFQSIRVALTNPIKSLRSE